MKIGLFAMSGVRVCDTELLELGLTLPGFVERSKTIASLPSLSLITLAGIQPEEHEYIYYDIDDIRTLPELPDDLDLVAISSFSAQIFEAYQLADYYRNIEIPVVMGGLHVTVLPEEALRHADAVVIGEGESCWLEVLRDAQAQSLQKYYRSEDTFSFNDAPVPAYGLLDIQKYNRLTIQTSRGCPWHCEFCASSILLTPNYRQKPVEKVLEEVESVKNIWDQPFIEFADDNSFVNKRYWKELLPQLKSYNLRWFTETDLSIYQDEEMLELMRECGCAAVLIGFESAEADSLDGLELRNNWKYRHWSEYQEAIDKIQSHGIRVNGCFVLGLDQQKPNIFEEVLRFVEQSELYDVQITIQTPFPGTSLYERLKREGRLIHPKAWERCTLFDIMYQPLQMSIEELRRGFHHLAKHLYNAESTYRRRERFRKHYLRPLHDTEAHQFF
jgi:radical SAM superfamily enzyme YgiQ (UPF0313 family)